MIVIRDRKEKLVKFKNLIYFMVFIGYMKVFFGELLKNVNV